MFDLAFGGFLALGFARCGDLQSDIFGFLVFIFFFLFMLCLFMLVLLLLRLFVVVTSDCLV